jgi:hypothetical protein
MNSRSSGRRSLAALLIVCGCNPPTPGPELALELVRRALAAADPALARHTDARLVAEVAFMRTSIEAIRYASHGHAEHNEALTPTLFARTWEEHQRTHHDAREALRPALAWLGGGRCTRVGGATVPEALAPLPPADEAWPASLRARHAEVSRQLRAVFALRFRCAPGVPFTVTFLPASTTSEPPKVLMIERR